MIFDFSFYLLMGVCLTGIIWLLDKFVLAPKRKAVVQTSTIVQRGVEIKTNNKEPVIVEYAKSFFPVLLIVFLLRGFVVEPFRIPSGSMLPTLYIGDFILVNKFVYGIRLPVIDKKIINISEPKRGDVVVFRYPRNPSIDYIKRVVGLPGDHIAYYNKELYVNGKKIPRKLDGPYTGPGQIDANEYTENLLGVKHKILLIPSRPNTLQGEYIVPQHAYFCMGDNRDNSSDSRVWGTMPEKNLVGKAFMIWMHYSDEWHWERIGDIIK